jgi:mitochondrial fission protein ELM1
MISEAALTGKPIYVAHMPPKKMTKDLKNLEIYLRIKYYKKFRKEIRKLEL